ncbi:MAG: DUF2169 domain-containing protein [Polyangiaceae bacterium]|nr:DUF2169 domain-containing protein [Polyangiaceae bacterium]
MTSANSSCPLRVTSVVWQPADGMFMLAVICKATFSLEIDESPLAEDQDDVVQNDEYWNEDEHASLSDACDLVPFKRGVDVILVGHAYAPRVLSELPFCARLSIGTSIDKAIEIHGERHWSKDDELVEQPCPRRMPLRWERATGGPGTTNPVGVPHVALAEKGQTRKLPNLEPPRTRLARPTDVIPPIGFGPIAPSWPERKSKIDTKAGEWDHRRWFDKPLAPYVDASFFNAAPLDQRLDTFVGDERIVLENLHPEFPRFSTHLAPIRPRAEVHKSSNATFTVDLRCDTLCIDTDRLVCTLTWRGSVPLAHATESARVEVTIDSGPRAETGMANSTVMLDWEDHHASAAAPALPFAGVKTHARPPFDAAAFPIERFAAISAELNEGRAPRHHVLEAHRLGEDDWKTIEAFWMQKLDEEAALGKHALRAMNDQAYIAAVEVFRGPITPAEVASIVASLERGEAYQTLDELNIQQPALMPILRSWTRKPARDLVIVSAPKGT